MAAQLITYLYKSDEKVPLLRLLEKSMLEDVIEKLLYENTSPKSIIKWYRLK